MKILIAYASNSGSTYLVAKQIAKELQPKHEMTLKKAALINPAELLQPNVVLFGSPSWLVGGKEGMPLEGMRTLLDKMQAVKMAPKRFAVFGCGESTFAYFCGAVDVIDKHLRVLNAESIAPALKIDEYFLRLAESEKQISAWTKVLSSALEKLKM